MLGTLLVLSPFTIVERDAGDPAAGVSGGEQCGELCHVRHTVHGDDTAASDGDQVSTEVSQASHSLCTWQSPQ